jgi:hypothetical protein
MKIMAGRMSFRLTRPLSHDGVLIFLTFTKYSLCRNERRKRNVKVTVVKVLFSRLKPRLYGLGTEILTK